MSIRLSTLAERVGGILTGSGELEITAAATIRHARPGEITLADDVAHLETLRSSAATAVVLGPNITPPTDIAYITVENPRAAFCDIVKAFRPPRAEAPACISPAAHISPTARIAADVLISTGCVIGDDVEIGHGCRLHPNVTVMAGSRIAAHTTIFPSAVLYEQTEVGERVTIHAAVVLGAHGFGYELVHGRHLISSQLGHVVIEADVEIGAGTTIDRGTYGVTRIGEGTKIDNQVMIGHNCSIGKHNLICAQAGVAGSCTTGDYVVLAGQVGVRDHVTIADGVMIGAQSGVTESLIEAGKYLGSPAVTLRNEIQCMMARQRLPEMLKALRRLEREMEHMSAPSEIQNQPSAEAA